MATMSSARETEDHPGRPAARGDGKPSRRSGWLARLGRGATGVAFLAAGALAWWWLTTHHFAGGDHAPPGAAQPGETDRPRAADVVTLAPGSAGAAEITLAPVETRQVREHLTVPGRLDYDARSRVDYQSPVEGIVSQVFVKVRQAVEKGASLAEVASPEVGVARDEVRKREDDLRIERKAADWAGTIADNVDALLEAFDSHPPIERIEVKFKDRVLGAYREKLLAAYSRLLFVEKVNASTRQLGEGGVLSGRIIEERTSNLEVAKANFTAACEEARFLTRQDRDRAQAALEQAERLVQISRENLRTLVGSRLDSGAAAHDAADAEGGMASAGAISSLVLRTPVDGIVEDIFVARGERVRAGDRLFVVANNSTLWVRAQIHERQWTTVEVADGQEVKVHVPGATEHDTVARINHVGATVEADSRSVPLVAELENDDAHYKPGMFVWVDLPQGRVRYGLTVPAGAVMRQADEAFVFVPEGEGRFRKVPIQTGAAENDFVEVKQGLEAGQQVVNRGAFLLKSELLLEDE
ncbi:MAG: efflux RND transporter periplasmic adaptor subunit [Planctomycetia bacterium]|nr:efflux RND transporter periplasmic adaptor subunit [Planctomycetia bacterium]